MASLTTSTINRTTLYKKPAVKMEIQVVNLERKTSMSNLEVE